MRLFLSLFLVLSLSGFSQERDYLLPIRENYLWGYVDTNANVIIKPQYVYAAEFNEDGYAVIQNEKGYGLINKAGDLVLSPDYDELRLFKKGLIAVKHSDGWYIQNLKSLEKKFGPYGDVTQSNRDLLHVRQGSEWGLFDKEKLLIETKYKAFEFTDKFIFAKNTSTDCYAYDGSFLFKGENPQIWPLNREKGLYQIRVNSRSGVMDSLGNIIVKPKWVNISWFSSELLKFADVNEEVLYSINEKQLLPIRGYNYLFQAQKTYLIFKRDTTLGLLNMNGDELITTKADRILPTNVKGLFYTFQDSLVGLLNEKSILISNRYDNISSFYNGLALLKKGKRRGLVNQKGKIVIPCKYKKFEWLNGVVRIKTDSLTYRYSFDSNGNLINKKSLKNFKTLKIKSYASEAPKDFDDLVTFANPNEMNIGFLRKKRNFGYRRNQYISVDSLNLDYTVRQNNDKLHKLTIGPNKIALTNFDFWFFDLAGFLEADVIRAIFFKGRNCLITRSGKIYHNGPSIYRGKPTTTPIEYIGPFREGLAPVNLGGRLDYYQKKTQKYNGCIAFDKVKLTDGKWGFVNSEGKFVIDGMYNKVKLPQSGRIIAKGLNNRWGVLNLEGDTIVDFKFNEIYYLENTNDEVFVVKNKTKSYGYINENGHELTEVIFNKASPFENGFAIVKIGTKYTFINQKGDTIAPAIFERALNFNQGIAAVRVNNQWGLIDSLGAWVMEPQFKNALGYGNGLAAVKKDKKYGYTSLWGEWIINPKYDKCYTFKYGAAIVKQNGKYGLIDSTGKSLLPTSYYKIEFLDDLKIYLAKSDGQTQLFDPIQQTTILSAAKGIKLLGKNRFALYKDKRYTLINGEKDKLSKPIFKKIEPFNEFGWSLVETKNGFGFIDTTGKFKIKPKYKKAFNFNTDYALVLDDGKWHVIDTNNTFLYSGVYKPKGIQENIVYCNYSWKKTKWGKFKSYQGNTLTNKQFMSVKPYENGYARVKGYNNKEGMINRQGVFTLDNHYSSISSAKNGYRIVEMKEVLGLFNRDGVEISEPTFEVVQPMKNGLFMVRKGGKVGYLNNQGNWFWELKR